MFSLMLAGITLGRYKKWLSRKRRGERGSKVRRGEEGEETYPCSSSRPISARRLLRDVRSVRP